jgi:spermidine/putrescine transport system permease protein
MSAPPRPAWRPNRLGLLWIALIAGFGFLYLPILTLVVMSFNASRSGLNFSGFSLRWYPELFADGSIGTALANSLVVAVGTMAASTVLGTTVAVGVVRLARSTALDAYVMAPAILPDLVLAIGLLVTFTAIGMPLGLGTVTIAHTAFGTAFVVAVVRARLVQLDRSLEEASADLGAGWFTTFTRVTLPSIGPAVLAGALLAFTLSIDEFVIAFFTNGPATTTLPIEIYSRMRFGITPEINALATILLVVSGLAVVIGARAFTRRTAQTSDEGMP